MYLYLFSALNAKNLKAVSLSTLYADCLIIPPWYSNGSFVRKEESPGCSETGFHLTDGHGNMRESATENEPPLCALSMLLNYILN